MTTSVLQYPNTLANSAKPARATQRPPVDPFSRALSLFRHTMKMMQAIPDNGRISPRQLAKVRAMAERL